MINFVEVIQYTGLGGQVLLEVGDTQYTDPPPRKTVCLPNYVNNQM